MEERNIFTSDYALSVEDKLFMICNQSCFSMPTISKINFYKQKWLETIGDEKFQEAYREYLNIQNKLFLDFKSICDEIKDEGLHHSLMEINKYLCGKNMPMESDEDVRRFITYIFSEYVSIKPKMSTANIDDTAQVIRKAFSFFLCKVFNWKIRAYEIISKANDDVRPEDDHFYEFIVKNIRICMNELLENTHKSSAYVALLIYLLQEKLGFIKTDTDLNIFLELTGVLSNVSIFNISKYQDEIVKNYHDLVKGNATALDLINTLKDYQISSFTDDIIKRGKSVLTRSYENKKTCNQINMNGLYIGDDIIENGSKISLRDLLYNIDLLVNYPDHIGSYLDNANIKRDTDEIFFSITENNVGYLKYSEKLPVAKVCTKDGTMYTIISKDGIMYLLFTLPNDGNVYGISFPAGNQDERKLVIFEIPEKVEYRMEM